MKYVGIGQCKELKRELVDFILRTVFFESSTSVTTKDMFEKSITENQPKLLEVANRICHLNLEVLKTYNDCKKKLKLASHPQLLEVLTDIQDQLNHLVFRHYLNTIEFEVLLNYPRYLKAIIRRLDKINHNILMDRKHMLEIKKYWSKYKSLKQAHSEQKMELGKLRWMIEEYRVSLWAQELKTPYPVSSKRLDQQVKILA